MNQSEYQARMADFINTFHRGLLAAEKGAGVSLRLDDPRSDEEVERAIRRDMYAKQNHRRVSGYTPVVCDFAFMNMRAMSTVANPQLPTSGMVDTVLTPSPAIDLALLGAPYLSRKFGDESYIGAYDSRPAWNPLDEDEEVPDSGGIVTSAVALTTFTGGTDKVDMTRRYRNQVAAAGEDGEADIVRLDLDSHFLNLQRVALNGDADGLQPKEPKGLEVLCTRTVDGGGAVMGTAWAEVQRLLKVSGASMNSLGVMMNDTLFAKYLATPSQTGTDAMVIRRKASVTGYVLTSGADDDGLPVGVEPGMSDGVMLVGQFSGLRTYLNTEIDFTILRTGAKDRTSIYSFVDYAVAAPYANTLFVKVVNA